MFFTDCHCDTLGLLDKYDFFEEDSLANVSYNKLVKANVKLQTFAICVPNDGKMSSYDRGNKLILNYKKILSNNNIMPVTDKKTLNMLLNSQKTGTILALEGCDMLEARPDAFDYIYDVGVRILSLTWNNSNVFSGGIKENNSGLTAKGKDLLHNCEKKGILIDVSHISEKGFWDIVSISSRPIIATHSNAKKICKNKRNLDDKQLSAVKNKKGCVGINFYPPFLNDSLSASVDDVINHIEYIAGLIGPLHVALGSDFDGVDNNLPKGIGGPQDIYKIYERLLQLNYSQEDVDNICGNNFIRLLLSILK